MNIPVHFLPEFQSGWEHKCQQKVSRLREYVTVGTAVNGESFSFNQLDSSDSTETTGQRLAKTVAAEPETDRRWIYPRTFSKTTIIDRKDNLFLGQSAINVAELMQVHASAFGRDVDRVIIDAAYGVNQTGKRGEVPAFVDQILDVKVGGGTQEVSMNLEKLLTIRETLKDVSALSDDAIASGDKLVIVVNANMITSLLRDTKLTSVEYAAVKALQLGEIHSFAGFHFVQSSMLPVDDNGHSMAIAYMKSGLHLRPWEERIVRITEDKDRSFAQVIFTEHTIGASRSEEKKFVFSPCAKVNL